MNTNKAAEKPYEGKSLQEAFYVKTVAYLANLKYVKWAQAITALAETES